MTHYVYILKCPDCEDEFFDFFEDAKICALKCLSDRPIITQTEVNRNDFGECTDHCDLGTVWSWEDMMKDAEPEDTVFSKDETFGISEGLDDFDTGPQIDEFDNSLDFDFDDDSTKTLWVAENLNGGEIVAACWADSEELAHRLLSQAFRERTGGDLKDCYIREAEADEPDYITDNPNLLAEACERKPIPEGMTLEELVEAMEENEDTVECTKCGGLFEKARCTHNKEGFGWCCTNCEPADTLVEEKQEYDLTELVKDSVSHLTYDLGKDPWADDFADDVITDLENNFDIEVPDDPIKYRDWCSAVASEVSRQVNKSDSKLEELEEAAAYRTHLELCPECGAENAFDHETGFCINCGFNL